MFYVEIVLCFFVCSKLGNLRDAHEAKLYPETITNMHRIIFIFLMNKATRHATAQKSRESRKDEESQKKRYENKQKICLRYSKRTFSVRG